MDIWGPDHHGYISRLSSAIDVLNKNNQENTFKVLICQQVNLLEDGKSIVMSKRLGKFHTMRDLLEKILLMSYVIFSFSVLYLLTWILI